jgi:hypothetical protein
MNPQLSKFREKVAQLNNDSTPREDFVIKLRLSATFACAMLT